MEKILETINEPKDLKNLNPSQLNQLAEEIRELIISTISKTGGHLASSLGAVDFTIALHSVFDSPNDKVIWDVGHQSYAHKILTGRRESFQTIRQMDGISGFPKRSESPHDFFGTGHSSTSVSASLGFAKARDLSGEKHNVIAVIGDGALTGGMAYEALNNAGHQGVGLIVVLNDNEMSISTNVGAMASYLSKLRMEPHFQKIRTDLRSLVKRIPLIGEKLFQTAHMIEEHLTYLVISGVLFEALGFTYLGPFDGHNIKNLKSVFNEAKVMKGPRFIHLLTQKGRGYAPAEQDATKWHGAVPFDIETGNSNHDKGIPSYTEVFSNTIVELAGKDEKITAITAAMPDGTGLVDFSNKYPKRFFDVGIAEEHAVTFAAALAAAGIKPVVAVYSTFLQRAYDQVIHDVCLQNLPVVFAIDRAGVVGEDGPTHHGVFDLSYLRSIPNMVLMAPKDENELRHMLKSAFEYNAPVAVRYPRGRGVGVKMDKELTVLPLGKAELLKKGVDLAIIAIGSMVYPALLAAEKLTFEGIEAAVVNARFIKPLDEELILQVAKDCGAVLTVEENVEAGGFGSAVMELINNSGIPKVKVKIKGLPDKFIEHGTLSQLKEKYALDADGIVEQARSLLEFTK